MSLHIRTQKIIGAKTDPCCTPAFQVFHSFLLFSFFFLLGSLSFSFPMFLSILQYIPTSIVIVQNLIEYLFSSLNICNPPIQCVSVVQWPACLTMHPLAWVWSPMRAVVTQLSQLFIRRNGLVNKWVPKETWEGKLWKVECHSGPVTWNNVLISTTGSKADVTRNERPHLCVVTACAPTLPSIHLFLVLYVSLEWKINKMTFLFWIQILYLFLFPLFVSIPSIVSWWPSHVSYSLCWSVTEDYNNVVLLFHFCKYVGIMSAFFHSLGAFPVLREHSTIS